MMGKRPFKHKFADLAEAEEYAKALFTELAQAKANCKNLTDKNAILRQRPDLPADRIPMAKELDRLHEDLAQAKATIEWMWDNCHIVYWPEHPAYPLEHSAKANKDARQFIEPIITKALKSNAGE
jgi:hypothetical protein